VITLKILELNICRSQCKVNKVMINKINDRMSDNLSVSLDRIVSRLEDQSEDEDLHHLPDQSRIRISLITVCSLRTNQPGFLCQFFQV
jgi:hypothetical protein